MGLLPKEGTTAWEASMMLFPDAGGYHSFLALSETVAHLDYAVAERKLDVERKGQHEIYWRPFPGPSRDWSPLLPERRPQSQYFRRPAEKRFLGERAVV